MKRSFFCLKDELWFLAEEKSRLCTNRKDSDGGSIWHHGPSLASCPQNHRCPPSAPLDLISTAHSFLAPCSDAAVGSLDSSLSFSIRRLFIITIVSAHAHTRTHAQKHLCVLVRQSRYTHVEVRGRLSGVIFSPSSTKDFKWVRLLCFCGKHFHPVS